jgi:alcohol dehydrogenase
MTRSDSVIRATVSDRVGAGEPSDESAPQRVVSVLGAHFEPDFPLNDARMFEREITLSIVIGNFGRDRPRRRAMIEAGVLWPGAVISDTMPLDRAAEAYRAFDACEATKVVLTTL